MPKTAAVPIQTPVLDDLCDVRGLNRIDAFKIRNGPGDLKDPVVGPGGKAQLVDDRLQKRRGVLVDGVVFLDVPAAHLGVAVDFGFLEPFLLEAPGVGHPTADRFGGFGRGLFLKILVLVLSQLICIRPIFGFPK